MMHPGPGRAGAPGSGFHRRLRRTTRHTSVRTAGRRPPAEQPARPVDGVGLGRLLGIASLTPSQAVIIAADLLADLASGPGRSNGNGARGAGRRVRLDTVVTGADGRSGLVADALPDLTGVSEVLAELARAAGRAPGGGPNATAELEWAATALERPDPVVALTAARLRDAVPDPDAVRAELARLAAAVHGRDGTGSVPAVPARGPAPPVPRGPTRREVGRRALARSWKGALTLTALAALVAVELVILDDRIARDITTVLDAGRSASESTAPVTGAPQAPPPPAPPEPAVAGAVAAVDVRDMGACEPGAGCEFRVAVLLAPAPEPRTVEWVLRMVDRCTGATAILPGGAVDVPPDAGRADAVQTVALPTGQALAVTAVTTRPAVAASRPLPVPAAAVCAPVPPTASGGS